MNFTHVVKYLSNINGILQKKLFNFKHVKSWSNCDWLYNQFCQTGS